MSDGQQVMASKPHREPVRSRSNPKWVVDGYVDNSPQAATCPHIHNATTMTMLSRKAF